MLLSARRREQLLNIMCPQVQVQKEGIHQGIQEVAGQPGPQDY